MSIIHFIGDGWFVREDGEPVRDDAIRIADAFGALCAQERPGSAIYVGYDTRPASMDNARVVAEVVASHGLRVKLSDTYCPTPALCEATRRDPEACAALLLTGNNFPYDYFGVRVRMADGSSASSQDMDVLEGLIPSDPTDARGEVELVDVMTPYLDGIASFVDTDAIARVNPIVVCDAMYGSMRGHAARLLVRLGARVIEVHGVPDEEFEGLHPEACEPWVDGCEQMAEANEAAMGLALDGGGDRLALVDELGRLVTPHQMVALVLEHLVRTRKMSGRMVVPIFGSSIVHRQAERLGCPLTVTPAGYTWMREEMAQGDVLLAGDALGGMCIPQVGFERDALAAAAVLLELVCTADVPLSALLARLASTVGTMSYGRRDVRMGPGDIQVLRNSLPGMNPEEICGQVPESISHPGGLMARLPGSSWLLVRPSRTEPLARVYAEAADASARDALLGAGERLARLSAPYGAPTSL